MKLDHLTIAIFEIDQIDNLDLGYKSHFLSLDHNIVRLSFPIYEHLASKILCLALLMLG